jgi:hypothetical protein
LLRWRLAAEVLNPRVSTMPREDPSADVLTEYDSPAEMTATGEIVDGAVHVHAVMGLKATAPLPGTCTRPRSALGSPAPTSSRSADRTRGERRCPERRRFQLPTDDGMVRLSM